jgi:hypothetical protein
MQFLGGGAWAVQVGRERDKGPEGWPINALAGRLYYHRRGTGIFGGAFDAVGLAGMAVNPQ